MAYASWQARKLACKGLYGIGIKVIATPAHIVEFATWLVTIVCKKKRLNVRKSIGKVWPDANGCKTVVK